MKELTEVLRDAFDADIRNAYVHADYIIWNDGLRLRRHAGDLPKIIPWNDFHRKLLRAMNLYHVLRELIKEYVQSYDPAKEVVASMSSRAKFVWKIEYDRSTGSFSISTSCPGGA